MECHARKSPHILDTWCQWALSLNCSGMEQNGSAHHWWVNQSVDVQEGQFEHKLKLY